MLKEYIFLFFLVFQLLHCSQDTISKDVSDILKDGVIEFKTKVLDIFDEKVEVVDEKTQSDLKDLFLKEEFNTSDFLENQVKDESGEERVIRGVVIDSDGNKEENAVVFIKGYPWYGAITDKNGEFTIIDPPLGKLTIIAYSADNFVKSQTIEVTKGKNSVLLKLFNKGTTISGFISINNDDSQDFSSVKVYLKGTLYFAFPDKNGKFAFKGVASGCFTPVVLVFSKSFEGKEVCVSNGEEKVLEEKITVLFQSSGCDSDGDCEKNMECKNGECVYKQGYGEEKCDGIDNDGDGMTDEGLGKPCFTEKCEKGLKLCVNGSYTTACIPIFVDEAKFTECGNNCCAPDEICKNGECIQCEPDCEGKECGDDGCGGTCGFCAPQAKCYKGFCITKSEKGCSISDLPGCDGCGCEKYVCSEISYCCESNWDLLCALTCEEAGGCFSDCVPNCYGKECGFDGCGNSCGECNENEYCNDGKCEECIPDCTNKECGDNGCGGSCGECTDGAKCLNGKCVYITEPVCCEVNDNAYITNLDACNQKVGVVKNFDECERGCCLSEKVDENGQQLKELFVANRYSCEKKGGSFFDLIFCSTLNTCCETDPYFETKTFHQCVIQGGTPVYSFYCDKVCCYKNGKIKHEYAGSCASVLDESYCEQFENENTDNLLCCKKEKITYDSSCETVEKSDTKFFITTDENCNEGSTQCTTLNHVVTTISKQPLSECVKNEKLICCVDITEDLSASTCNPFVKSNKECSDEAENNTFPEVYYSFQSYTDCGSVCIARRAYSLDEPEVTLKMSVAMEPLGCENVSPWGYGISSDEAAYLAQYCAFDVCCLYPDSTLHITSLAECKLHDGIVTYPQLCPALPVCENNTECSVVPYSVYKSQ